MPDPTEQGQVLHGQLLDKDFRTAIPYTQQIRNFNDGGQSPSQGNANTEITVIDGNSTEDKVFNYSALDSAKLAIFVQNPGFTSFDLPEELISLTAIFSTSKGTGTGTSTPTATSSGTSWSVGVSSSNKGSSSLDYIPDLQPEIKTHFTRNVPTIECYFFTSASQTMANVLSRLTTGLSATVLVWPHFKPVRHSFTMKGQALSLSAGANLQLSASKNSANTSYSDNVGLDKQVETKTSIRSLDLPPYLHGDISITSDVGGATPWKTSDTVGITVGTSITAAGDIPTTTISSGGTVTPITVSTEIFPHTLSATSPAAVPTSGLYLLEIRPQASEGDLFLQLAVVVDFAYFA
jgi:hypothetical protein